MRVGFLHPGSMGISLAVAAATAGHEACWASTDRSAATVARAAEHGIVDLHTPETLCAECEAIVSICPPHAADEIAAQVAACRYRGIYLDANAISPARARAIAATVSEAGACYVDGGVIGGPAWTQDSTTLYLSGDPAAQATQWFRGSLLVTADLGSDPVAASALKMCYAAYTKGTAALLYGILGTAEALGVRDALQRQWAQGGGGLADKAQGPADGVTSKAWRWIDEMQEISATFEGAGLPGGFHAAASEIFRRLGHMKDRTGTTTADVVQALLSDERERA